MTAVGIIDTYGFVVAVEALDTCLKTADVAFVRAERMSGGIISIVVKGDVSAVTAAIEAGVEAAKLVGEYRKHTIIARLDDQAKNKFIKKNDVSIEKTEKPLEAEAIKSDEIKADETVSLEKTLKKPTVISHLEKNEGSEAKKIIYFKKNTNNKETDLAKAEDSKEFESNKNDIDISSDEIIDFKGKTEIKSEKKALKEGVLNLLPQSGDCSEEALMGMTVAKLRKLAYKLNLNNKDQVIKNMRKAKLVKIISNEIEKAEV